MRVAECCPLCDSDSLVKKPAVLLPFIAHRAFGWQPFKITKDLGLRTLPEGHVYSLCNSCFCENCRFLFSDIRFDEEEALKLYRAYRGEEYTALRELYEPGYTETNNYLAKEIHYLRRIERHIEDLIGVPKTILDWGGDEGVNTPFKSHDTKIDIYDISGKDKKPENANKELKHFPINTKCYDLVICMHVFEHVSYPLAALQEIFDFIKPGGYIYIEVPLESVMPFRDCAVEILERKRHWHEHINFFNSESMTQLIERAGLEIIANTEMDVSDSYRTFNVQNALARRPE